MKPFVFITFLFASLAAAGCKTGGPAGGSLTLQQLQNTNYDSEWPANRRAKLRNGIYREPYAIGGASELVVQLSDKKAFGDLNGDGARDAAVVLVAAPGGSGTFYDLAVVLNDSGQPRHVASTPLGDRVRIESLSIADRRVTVQMLERDIGDPKDNPTKRVTRVYTFTNGRVVEVAR